MATPLSLKEQIHYYLPKAKKFNRDIYRHHRARALKLCDVLYKNHHAPTAWRHFTAAHTQTLIQFYRKKDYADMTIMRYFQTLRLLLKKAGCAYHVPLPKALGLIKQKTSKAKIGTLNMLDAIQYPPVLKILSLEMLFGLKKREAMQLVPSVAIQDNRLFISLAIASYDRERYIPIETTQQKVFIHQLLHNNPDTALINQMAYANLSLLYQSVLREHQYLSHIQYRFVYIHWRYLYLQKKGLTKPAILNQLCYELSIGAQHIRKVLHEQSIT